MNKSNWKRLHRSLREHARTDPEYQVPDCSSIGFRWLVAFHLNYAGLMRRCGFIEDAKQALRDAQWAKTLVR